MKKWLIILPALLLLGAACAVSKPASTLQTTNATTNRPPSAPQSVNNTPTAPPPQPAAPPVASEADCGTAGPVTAPGSTTYTADATTTSAWQCFVGHFELCTPAKISAALDSSNPSRHLEFNVIGKEGDVCKIAGPRINLQTGQMTTGSCNFTTRYLDAYFTQSAKNNTSLNQSYLKGYLMANLVMIGMAKPITYADGTSGQVTCK